MSSEDSSDQSISVSVPAGAAVAALVLAIAAAVAYVLIGRTDETGDTAGGPAKTGKSMIRRLGIMGLVTMIENDATRKLVVAVLKAMARRA